MCSFLSVANARNGDGNVVRIRHRSIIHRLPFYVHFVARVTIVCVPVVKPLFSRTSGRDVVVKSQFRHAWCLIASSRVTKATGVLGVGKACVVGSRLPDASTN